MIKMTAGQNVARATFLPAMDRETSETAHRTLRGKANSAREHELYDRIAENPFRNNRRPAEAADHNHFHYRRRDTRCGVCATGGAERDLLRAGGARRLRFRHIEPQLQNGAWR